MTYRTTQAKTSITEAVATTKTQDSERNMEPRDDTRHERGKKKDTTQNSMQGA